MRYLKILSYVLVLTSLLITSTSVAGNIDESTKRAIYEIMSPGVGQGTGFAVSDSVLGYVLVTCRHVVQDKNGNYVDSVLVRRNKCLSPGEVISDTSQFILHLKVDGHIHLAEHPDPNVDLIMIPIRTYNTTLAPNESISGLISQSVLSEDEIKSLRISEGTDVELIGFSLPLPKEGAHYHFSRFGKVGLYPSNGFTLIIDNRRKTANYILVDMTTRPGDSGSPIIVHNGDKSYLIGFLCAGSDVMEFGVVYPIYYLHDLMKVVRDKFSTASEKKTK